MRTYISTLGFDEARVTRPVLKRGIDEGDEVVIVRPQHDSDDKRAEEALTGVEQFVSEIEPAVSFDCERVPHEEFEASVIACSDIIRAAEGSIIVNLGGGARDILLPLTIATLVHLDRVETVLFFSDLDRSHQEWSLPNVTANPPTKSLETLQVLANVTQPISISELSSHSTVAKSTVGRHIDKLATVDAVRTETEGKTKQVELTLTGKLLLQRTPDSAR
ncbi:CRISPR-associated CARF protein Csa3 [Halorussus halophilus]|uniref:CRISPR-associated CARF protein Csa3 n=1 Tax=Halorussus halophilus TaxID=2650975 RepID=UPI0013016C3E|nr:CRISPR-associated CARF protein Csa3 [Halorussus halophilus]